MIQGQIKYAIIGRKFSKTAKSWLRPATEWASCGAGVSIVVWADKSEARK